MGGDHGEFEGAEGHSAINPQLPAATVAPPAQVMAQPPQVLASPPVLEVVDPPPQAPDDSEAPDQEVLDIMGRSLFIILILKMLQILNKLTVCFYR